MINNNNTVQLNQAVENFRKVFQDNKLAEQKKSDWRTMAKRSTVTRQVIKCPN